MSELRRGLITTILVAVLIVFLTPMASLPAGAAGESGSLPDTWTPTQALPARGGGVVLALAVDPRDPRRVLAGTTGGAIDLSTDGGATWRTVRSGLAGGVLALAFDPFEAGRVLAGSGEDGIWASQDGGESWSRATGGGWGPVRAFALTPNLALAGTDHGVWASRGTGPWLFSGLGGMAVSALAAWGDTDAPLVVAGGDGGGETAVPLYRSPDGARTWIPFNGTVGASTMVAALAVGPLAARQSVPRLVLGTNAGLFASGDEGVSWQQLTGDGALPPADFTAIAFAPQDPQRLYVASDGGGSSGGGLWVSSDGGAHFASLQPPVPSVTALAVAGGPVPTLYVATLRPSDQAVQVWSYLDAGGTPQQARRPRGVASHGRVARPPTSPPTPLRDRLVAWLRRPETPYLGAGALAALVILLALVAYARRERRL